MDGVRKPETMNKDSGKSNLAAITPEALTKAHITAAKSRLSTKKQVQHKDEKPLVHSFDQTKTKSRLHNIFRSNGNEVQLPTFLDDNSPAALSAAASAIAKAASEVADRSEEQQPDSTSGYHHYVIFKPTRPNSMPADSIQSYGPTREDEVVTAGAENDGKGDELASIERRLKSLEVLVAEMAESKGLPTPGIDATSPDAAAWTPGNDAEAREGQGEEGAAASSSAEEAPAGPDAAIADAADAVARGTEEEGGSEPADAREEEAGGDAAGGIAAIRSGQEEGAGKNPEADAAIEKALHDFAKMSKMAAAENARRYS